MNVLLNKVKHFLGEPKLAVAFLYIYSVRRAVNHLQLSFCVLLKSLVMWTDFFNGYSNGVASFGERE